jgi:hypothetical protein
MEVTFYTGKPKYIENLKDVSNHIFIGNYLGNRKT